MTYYNKNISEIFHELGTSAKGLTEEEAGKRLKKYGTNELKKKKGTGIFGMILSQFTNLMVIILIAASAVAFVLGERNDAVVIFIVVLINAIVGFIQEYKAEKSLEALMKMMAPHAKVMRDGKEEEIEAKNLVPGDIIVLEAGDRIPADSRLIEVIEAKVEESALTGESLSVEKKTEAMKKSNIIPGEQKNMVFMGTSITDGRAKAVVVETGMKTEFGKVAELTQTIKKEKTPLQKELNRVGKFIGKAVLAICVIIFIIALLREGVFTKEVIVANFLFAVALAVAAVPEGLPATVTIAMALGVQRMVKKNAIMRKLTSVETLGSTTVICSDKTGTLTKNEMTVKEIYVNDELVHVSGVGYEPKGMFTIDDKQVGEEYIKKNKLLFAISSLCNNSSLVNKDGRWSITGDPTEASLIVMSEKAGFKEESLQPEYKRIHENPFESERKRMSTVHRKKDGEKLVFVKGAPDEVLAKCAKIKVKDAVIPLTAERKKKVMDQNTAMAEEALRVLAVAYKPVNGGKENYSIKKAEKDLILVGLVGMIDPPRPEVAESIELCKKAGIRIFIVTGDYGVTAKAIAQRIGLAEEHTKVITGAELDKISDEHLRSVLHKKEAIFARVSPKHKLRVVETLEKQGQIVAVTGDGVNDAPALKKASIGVAMGITGTDVSKESADMVLTDDSFASIVSAVKEGRSIYSNIQKFMRYLFTTNLGEIFVVFGAIMSGLPLPILATQILWINLVTDVMPALALGVEPAEKDIMDHPPRNPKQRMITKTRFLHWMTVGLVIAIGVLSTFVYYLFKGGWTFGQSVSIEDGFYIKALTMSFTVLVISQLIRSFSCKSPTKSVFSSGLLRNKWLLLAVSISVLLQFGVVNIPFFQRVFNTTALSLVEWLIVVGIGISVLIYDEIRKIIARETKSKLYKGVKTGVIDKKEVNK